MDFILNQPLMKSGFELNEILNFQKDPVIVGGMEIDDVSEEGEKKCSRVLLALI